MLGGGSVRSDAPVQRLWFYDLSANPDPWTRAWDITNKDINGDRVEEIRMAPIWEYGTRKASTMYGRKVTPDLAKVVRYTALNLLFTPSPIYRVTLTAPTMPEDIQLNVQVGLGAGAQATGNVLKPQLMQERLSALQPFGKISTQLTETSLENDLVEAYKCFLSFGCSPEYADSSGERLFAHGVRKLRKDYTTSLEGKYILPIYAFHDSESIQGAGSMLGIAYDDNQTGTQSFVYTFLTPQAFKEGHGFTDTIVHEAGHHFGLAHPHDGYDSEENLSYGPSGEFYFVNVGDESATVMSYNDLSHTFGQFNLDNHYRYLTSAYLNTTNAILELSRQNQKAEVIRQSVQSADRLFGQAVTLYKQMSYVEAAKLAHQGYREVLTAALSAGVDIQPYKWYENLTGLSAQAVRKHVIGKPRISKTFLPQKGAVIFPEETAELRRLRDTE